jgi:hypothetical protein
VCEVSKRSLRTIEISLGGMVAVISKTQIHSIIAGGV